MSAALHPAARTLPSQRDESVQRRSEQPYLPTLFDRLQDDEPSQSSEAPSAYAMTRAQMREIVRRDIAMLLNTTNQEDLLDRKRFSAAASSTVNYGVPALAGGYLSEKRWADIEKMIRRAVIDFEPRLAPGSLRVTPLLKEAGSANYNVLLFEISGQIHMQPYPMAFTVQTAVDLETSRLTVLD